MLLTFTGILYIMNAKLSQRRTGRATDRPLKAYMSETLTETQQPEKQQLTETFDALGGERIREPDEPLILGNDVFRIMVEDCQRSTHKTYGDQAVVLLNSILMGNPNAYIRLDPEEEKHEWVNRFRAIYGYDYNGDGEIVSGYYPHPRQKEGVKNDVLDRLIFAEADPDIESLETQPQHFLSADMFYNQVAQYSRQNRTSFDFEAVETLRALLETRRGNIAIALPKREENTPWLQAYRKHCEKIGSNADSRILTYDAIDATTPPTSPADSHSSLMRAA